MATYDFPIPNFRTSTEPGALAGLSIIDPSSSWLHSTDDEDVTEEEENTLMNGTRKEEDPGHDTGREEGYDTMRDEDVVHDTMKEVTSRGLQVPTHPISSMQGAFAESMLEASEASTPSTNMNEIAGSSAERRQILLEQDVSEDTHATRWRRKPGQKYHELWKLMAQISFGIYLLLNGIAKDDEQVMTILQGHVDEVDSFLESTLEDFDLAQQDIDERLKFLKIPLDNILIFDAMLEDRDYRLQIVNGNEVIEHVITRTAKAMNDALRDVQQGLDACKEFMVYLGEEQEDPIWKEERPEMQKVFEAMKCNVEGWHKANVLLQTKGNHLGVALVQLGSIVAEMDRRAGEVSRKTRFSTPQSPTNSTAATPRTSPRHISHSSRQMRRSMLKDLPSDPTLITPAIRATLPAFQLVQDRERTPEPEKQEEPEQAETESKVDDASTVSEKLDEPEPEFILKPRTYSPSRSPQPPRESTQPTPEPAGPAPKQRNSLRDRFSLKRKEVQQPQNPKPTPQDFPAPPTDTYWGPRQPINSITANRPEASLNTPLQTPPSRGLDSAYCSDFERPSPPGTLLPSLIPISSTPSSHSQNSTTIPTTSSPRRFPPGRTDSPPVISSSSTLTARDYPRDYVPSPRSEHQFFRPVLANPNSPLQRPWTAAPPGSPQSYSSTRTHPHPHPHSSSHNQNYNHHPSSLHNPASTSNLRGMNHAHTPSRLGDRAAAPSAMGMSVMSGRTAMTDVTEMGSDGVARKVKKKRSAMGWLRKQFSLSEEERAAFEERKGRREMEERRYANGGAGGVGNGAGWGDGSGSGSVSVSGRRETRWIDGRRVK